MRENTKNRTKLLILMTTFNEINRKRRRWRSSSRVDNKWRHKTHIYYRLTTKSSTLIRDQMSWNLLFYIQNHILNIIFWYMFANVHQKSNIWSILLNSNWFHNNFNTDINGRLCFQTDIFVQVCVHSLRINTDLDFRQLLVQWHCHIMCANDKTFGLCIKIIIV